LIALTACGAALLVLTPVGLSLQARDALDGFVAVALVQGVVYAVAVRLVWDRRSSRRAVYGIAVIAVLIRVPVVVSPPYLSVDVYRYLWDGRIEAAGFNPYRYAPNDPRLERLRDNAVFPQIGSKDAPTIYPPVAEAIFLGVTRFGERPTAIKLAMVVCEAVAFVLLVGMLAAEGLPTTRVLVYAWHPLALWEFAGSGHLDAVLIPFILAALWAARRGRQGLGGLFLAAATLTKLYPAVMLPALYRRWGWTMPATFAATILVAYLPFLGAGAKVLGFLPRYATQEGFDAGGAGFYLVNLVHHALPLIAIDARLYRVVALAVLAVLGVACVLLRDPARPPFAMAALLATVFMIIVSPHYPWYFAWLIVFACFVRSFALLWLTTACLALYLVRGYVFLADDQRFAIETAIYAPFAALAAADLWYHRRGAVRSSEACRPA
jgi:hypothetical protein